MVSVEQLVVKAVVNTTTNLQVPKKKQFTEQPSDRQLLKKDIYGVRGIASVPAPLHYCSKKLTVNTYGSNRLETHWSSKRKASPLSEVCKCDTTLIDTYCTAMARLPIAGAKVQSWMSSCNISDG
jgi:hypothetical protein